MGSGWLGRRRSPRLSGILHLRDATGHEVAVPLRGRATVLTTGGYGEVWAVHTEADGTHTSLMISYGRDGAEGDRASGLCAAGETVVLSGVSFTWRHQVAQPDAPEKRIPQVTPDAVGVPDAHAPADAHAMWNAHAPTDAHATTDAQAPVNAQVASDARATADARVMPSDLVSSGSLDMSVMSGGVEAPIPRPRENMPRVVGAGQAANIRVEPARKSPLHNMLRVVKQASRGKRSTNPAPASPPPPP